MKPVITISDALSQEQLFAKSQAYVRKALAAKKRDDLDDYQLAASIALELLAKSALSSIHPSLIVDTANANNLLVAAGIPVETTVKTITAEEAYSRLRHVSKEFAACFEFSKKLARRRNAELHSAELPYKAMKPESWEGEFWHAADVILQISDSSLDVWLGANDAKATRFIIEAATTAKRQTAIQRVEHAAKIFEETYKGKERQARITASESLSPFDASKNFRLIVDAVWDHKCPACSSRAFLGGDKYHETENEAYDEPGWVEILTEYIGEEFYCPTCDLRLEGDLALRAAGINIDHVESEEREAEYEAEYGND